LKKTIKLKYLKLLTSNTKNKKIINWLVENKIPYSTNIELGKKSWLKAGGIAEFFIQPESIEDTVKLIRFLINQNINYYPVGNISNTLFRDGVIKTPLINLKNIKNTIIKIDNRNREILTFKASAGMTLFKYVNYLQSNFFLSGQEGLIGIPGTIGGAIYTNASSYNSSISDYIVKLEYINDKGEVITLKKEEIQFGWRYSIFHEKKNFLILQVYFNFPLKKTENKEFFDEKVMKIREDRKKFQENKLPNLGSLYATKNLYRDLSKISTTLFFLYIIYLVGTKLIYVIYNGKYLLRFRRLMIRLYSAYFGIGNDHFSLSEKTINCLVNKGSSKSVEAFKLIYKLEKKIKNKIRLENVLVEDIE